MIYNWIPLITFLAKFCLVFKSAKMKNSYIHYTQNMHMYMDEDGMHIVHVYKIHLYKKYNYMYTR